MTEGPSTPLGEDSKHEYAGERDMDRFWETARLEREPARQWWYIPLVLGLILISIPWYAARYFAAEAAFLGLPLWIWIPIACTLALSILTAIAALGFWGDGDSDSD